MFQALLLASTILYGAARGPILDLDFVNNPAGALSRLTVSRVSGATYFDATGTLQTAASNVARIDYGSTPGGVTNYCLQSQTIGGSGWTGYGPITATVNASTAPDGSNTASLISNTSGGSQFAQGITSLISGQTYTVSCHLKAGSVSQAGMDCFDGTRDIGVMFSLIGAGAVGSYRYANTVVASGIISLGNGWYRCWFSFVSQGSGSGQYAAQVQGSSDGTFSSWSGNFYAWGYQHELGGSLSKYVATTTTPVTVGAIPKGLLVEEQRTNSIRNPRCEGAVAGTPGTFPTNWGGGTNSSGLSWSIAGFGSEMGIPYVDIRLSGTATGASEAFLFFEGTAITAAAANSVWAEALFIRRSAGSNAGLNSAKIRLFARGSGGTAVDSADSPDFLASISASNLALNRQSFTRTLTNASTQFAWPAFVVSHSATSVDITLRIGLPQLELGAFATSPIMPPAGSPAASTRAVDQAFTTGLFFLQAGLSLAAEYSLLSLSNPNTNVNIRLMAVSDGTTANSCEIYNNGVVTPNLQLTSAGVGISIGANAVSGTGIHKAAGSVSAASGLQICSDAGSIGTTPQTVPISSFTRTDLGNRVDGARPSCGYIRRARLWNRVLSTTELQMVTT